MRTQPALYYDIPFERYADALQLTPFVAETVQKTRTTDSGQPEVYPKRFTGEDYLRAWKMAGGHDIVYEEEASQTRTNMPVPFEEKRA